MQVLKYHVVCGCFTVGEPAGLRIYRTWFHREIILYGNNVSAIQDVRQDV